MKIEIELPKDVFVLGENIPVDVRVLNTGGAPVQLPLPSEPTSSQPAYTLTGPAFPEGVTFSFRSVKQADPRVKSAGVSPALETLAPGETFEHGFWLDQWNPIAKPGRYTLQARLHWQDVDVSSEPLAFDLIDNSFQSAGIGLDLVDPGPARTVRVAWLGEGQASRTIGQALFYEKRPDLAEFRRTDLRSLLEVGNTASEPMMPWANYDRPSRSQFWLAWREESRLLAWNGLDAPPQSLELPDETARIVHPALLPSSGELYVFVLSAGQRELSLLRFGPVDEQGASPPPQTLSSVSLSSPAGEGRAVLAPEALGGEARVVLSGQDGDIFSLMLWGAGTGSRAAAVRTIRIPDTYVLAGSRPALRVDSGGRSHVSVVVSRDAAGTRAAVLDVIVPRDDALPIETELTPLPLLEEKIVAAATAFEANDATDFGRSWVVMLASGEVVHDRSPEQRLTLPVRPVLPLELLCKSGASYLLLLDEARGPILHSLP